MAPRPAGVPLTAVRVAEVTQSGQMPELRGMSARDALRTLTRHGLTARIDGDGFVTEQSPHAGTPLVPGDQCIIKLGRRPVLPAGGLQQ